jgi:hypothetical protein
MLQLVGVNTQAAAVQNGRVRSAGAKKNGGTEVPPLTAFGIS